LGIAQSVTKSFFSHLLELIGQWREALDFTPAIKDEHSQWKKKGEQTAGTTLSNQFSKDSSFKF